MKKFFIVTALVLLALACERDEVFTCSLVESEVVEVTETSVTIEAIVAASNFENVPNAPKSVVNTSEWL